MSPSTTSLVLGSGGARGLAHIGVIRYLTENGYDIRYVAGSSMGALVGGIYAAGKLDIYSDWVCALQKSDIVRLLDWSFSKGSLFKGERIISILKELIGEYEIEKLPIGYTAVATDISRSDRSHEVWLNKGSLFDAIRASIAIPTVFAPVELDGHLLVDGGVVNPVPVGPTLNDRSAITIAVDLNGKIDPNLKLHSSKQSKPNKLQQAYQTSIGRYLDKLWPNGSKALSNDEQPGFYDLLTRSMEAMQATITHFKLAATVPSVVINIPCNAANFFEFHRAKALIDYGYERAQQTLERHQQAQ